MASTRRKSSMHIFQDQLVSHDGFPMIPTPYQQQQPVVLQNSPTHLNTHNIILQPPNEYLSLSPAKRHSSPPSPPDKPDGGFESLYLAPPDISRFMTDSPEKHPSTNLSARRPSQRPEKALFPTWANGRANDKENMYAPVMYRAGSTSSHKGQPNSPYRTGPAKHRLVDSAPLRERSVKRSKTEDEEQVQLPDPEDMPALHDDGAKPAFSYATLISMAILRAPNRRLTLSQIYKWIQDTFSFYKDAETGWMNSIRHNLSLNKAFVKKDRPKDDPGKGCYWTIEDGMEKQFLKDKPLRKAANSDVAYFHSMSNDLDEPQPLPTTASFLLPSKPTKPIDAKQPSIENDISSDATLPASDPAAPQDDDDADDLQMPPPFSRVLRSSPPPMPMRSSPPVGDRSLIGITPPTLPVQHNNRKKRVDNFRDSGFYSSIESSASRPGPGGHGTAGSEMDIERSGIKRGRAEDEIARIRGSSFDQSPTKSKHIFKQPNSSLLPSSPLRPLEGAGLLPLTPGLKLNATRRIPASTSPNTYLRRHRESVRELVGTPAHGLAVSTEDLAWSPAFKIHETFNPSPCKSLKDGAFSSFTSLDEGFFGDYDAHFARGSPVRASVRRPLLQRANTFSSGLKESASITTMLPVSTSGLASPIRMAPKTMPAVQGSPSKASIAAGTSDDPLWGVDIDSDDEDDQEIGAAIPMDLTRGFQKIVGAAQPRPSARPLLGRRVTNEY